jgi:hypothetical protein
VYLIFFAWDLVGLTIIYIWVVETKQLSLEDKERAKFEKEQERRRVEGV